MSKLKNSIVGALALATFNTGFLVQRSMALAAPPRTQTQQPPVIRPSQDRPQNVERPTEFKDSRPAIGSKALASLVWSITDGVAKHHDKPCPREQMIGAGLKALYTASKVDVPGDLEARSAAIMNPNQLAERIEKVLDKNDPATKAKLENALVQAVLSSIPGKAALVEQPSKKELAVQEQVSANRYVGIGISLMFTNKEGSPKVTSTILHGAARKAGMKADDVIEAVDGKDTKGVALAQVVDWLRGPEGSPITVTVRHPGAAQSTTFKMIRAKVPFEHIYGYRRISEEEFDFRVDAEAPIAYLRIGSLSSSSLHEMRQFERKLHAAGFRALVLDLRGNPGGSLQHAALVAGSLLDGNLMWTTRQDRVSAVQEFRADHECLFRNWPMVVLINNQLGTASSLIGAALHDNGRAVLVGEFADMDGYIKSMIELPGQKESLVLATGRVERPKAEQGWPLKPDFAVKLLFPQRKEIMNWTEQQEISDRPIDPQAKAPADPQLAKATELLRAELAKTALSKKP